MASTKPIDQLKAQLDRMRRESVDVVANASRIVVEGVQKLAEQELQALNDYYKKAVGSAKKAREKSGAKGYQELAAEQIDLLQDTVQKVLENARTSLAIIADTRTELARLVSVGEEAADSKAVSRVTAPARKAIEDIKRAASKAQKSAADTARSLRKSLDKEIAEAERKGREVARGAQKQAKKSAKSARKRLDTVLDVKPPKVVKKNVTTRPSSTSRAARAARAAGRTTPAASKPAAKAGKAASKRTKSK